MENRVTLITRLLAMHGLAACHPMGAFDPGEVGAASNHSAEPDPREASRLGLGYQSSSPADAAIHAGAAVAAFAVVGCSVNGCQAPLVCDEETRLCRTADCSEETACPNGQACNFAARRCE